MGESRRERKIERDRKKHTHKYTHIHTHTRAHTQEDVAGNDSQFDEISLDSFIITN